MLKNVEKPVRAVRDDDKLIIHIKGDFDYKKRREFVKSYENAPTDTRFIVNLRDVDYMDSSGLGMLVMLREHAGGDTARVTLTNCKPNIKQLLKYSQFTDLFIIL